jgi:hypothetical protein
MLITMKKIKILVLAAVVLFTGFSCEEALDVNVDPLAATSADPNAVLPYVIVQFSSRKVTELGSRIPDVSQYFSDTFNSPKNGTTSIFLTGNTWGMMYNLVLGNLSLVKADALAAGETSYNVAAIATTLEAMVYLDLTSLWGDVPFTEAINGQDFPTPAFDSQETVLRGVVALCDEAISLIDNTAPTGTFNVSQGDMLFGGNMDNWRRYANSLKLRALMLLRNKVNVDSEIATALGQPVIETNAQAVVLEYSTTPGGFNGLQNLVESFFGSDNESTDVFGPGPPLYDLLVPTGDPRADVIIARNDLEDPGIDVFPTPTTAVLSNNIIRRDLPDMWMLPAEIDFYKAELALDGVAAAGDATTNYANGLQNIMSWYGGEIPGATASIAQADIDAFIAAEGTPTMEDVYNQQFLAAFLHPVLAWNHVRRNKVPVLETPPNSTITTYLKRFNYPPDEVASNPNTPANLPTDVPMWFEN